MKKTPKSFSEVTVTNIDKQIDGQKKHYKAIKGRTPADNIRRERIRDTIERYRDRRNALTGNPKSEPIESVVYASRKKKAEMSEAKDMKDIDFDDLRNVDYVPGQDKLIKRAAIKRKRADVEHEATSADKIPQAYIDVKSRQRVRMVPADREIVKESKAEYAMMAYTEKKAVKDAKASGVGNMSRSEKEKWIDAYIQKNKIPSGALGSAVYSGVMKVKDHTKKITEKTEADHPNLAKHISAFSKGIKSSSAKDGRYVHGGGKIPNYKVVTTDADKIAELQSKLSNSSPENRDHIESMLQDLRRKNRNWVNRKRGISEEIIDEALNFQQRLKRAISLRKNKAKLAMGRRRNASRIADNDRLLKRANRKARGLILKKLTKGIDKSELSPARKAELEKRLDKMKPRIEKIARKILPQVRKDEIRKKRGGDEAPTKSTAVL